MPQGLMFDLFLWLAVIIIFAVVEGFTLDLSSIWFSVGGIFGMISALFIRDFFIQFIIFSIFTIICLIFLRPISKKLIFKKGVDTNVDRLIGELAIVTDKIQYNKGEVRIDGKIWTARNISPDEEIEIGQKVQVLEIKGVKLIIKKI